MNGTCEIRHLSQSSGNVKSH